MPRIAVLADIHGNLFALEAVIADLAELGVDEVMVAGDLVGRGPQGRDVVSRIREEGWACVRGNHEDYLISFFRREIPVAWWVDEEWAASRWMARDLDADTVDFLDSLPFTCQPALAQRNRCRTAETWPSRFRSRSRTCSPWHGDAGRCAGSWINRCLGK